jgi:G:T/U-mismatch repair DNA glycosylase
MRVVHPFEPIFDEESQVLILGTFPSIKSRETGFYYGHPQNRISLWDVLQSCDIEGSNDNNIKNATPTDLSIIFSQTSINYIYANGAQAYHFYHKYCNQSYKGKIIQLPSTSPANAKYSLEQLVSVWAQIVR